MIGVEVFVVVIVVGVSLVSTLVPHAEQKRAFGGNIVRQLMHDFPLVEREYAGAGKRTQRHTNTQRYAPIDSSPSPQCLAAHDDELL